MYDDVKYALCRHAMQPALSLSHPLSHTKRERERVRARVCVQLLVTPSVSIHTHSLSLTHTHTYTQIVRSLVTHALWQHAMLTGESDLRLQAQFLYYYLVFFPSFFHTARCHSSSDLRLKAKFLLLRKF